MGDARGGSVGETTGGTGLAGRVYRRRRPERTVPHRLVRTHLETNLARAQEADPLGDGVPNFVEGQFRAYLRCGVLAHGVARARCGGCGEDFLVASSCNGRGIYPSCNARRIAATVAHLTDHVIPRVPVRQWVLSVPRHLRPRAARVARRRGRPRRGRGGALPSGPVRLRRPDGGPAHRPTRPRRVPDRSVLDPRCARPPGGAHAAARGPTPAGTARADSGARARAPRFCLRNPSAPPGRELVLLRLPQSPSGPVRSR